MSDSEESLSPVELLRSVPLFCEPVIGSGHEQALLSAGFSRGPRKLTASAG